MVKGKMVKHYLPVYSLLLYKRISIINANSQKSAIMLSEVVYIVARFGVLAFYNGGVLVLLKRRSIEFYPKHFYVFRFSLQSNAFYCHYDNIT